MKSLLPPVTGTLAVFVIVLAVFLWRQNRVIGGLHDGLAATRAGVERQHEEHQQEIRGHERALQDANDTIAQLRRELAVARAAAGLENERELPAADPAAAEHRHRQQRRMIQERYGDLFNRLNLSPVALEELKRLLLELESPPSTRDVGVAGATDAGESTSRRTFAETHDQIYNLLGYEGYTAFERYTRELTSSRPMVRRFAADAADAGYPLSAVQRTALSQAIFEVTDPQISVDAITAGANNPDPATGLTPLDQKILTRAADILSSPQVELLRAFRVRERAGLAAWRDSLAAPPAEETSENGATSSP